MLCVSAHTSSVVRDTGTAQLVRAERPEHPHYSPVCVCGGSQLSLRWWGHKLKAGFQKHSCTRTDCCQSLNVVGVIKHYSGGTKMWSLVLNILLTLKRDTQEL